MSQERRKLTQEDKNKIGIKCCNCDSVKDLEYHHIVPLSLGGNDINSNMVCLCYQCHSLIHYGKTKIINHSDAIKRGIQKRIESGEKFGRPKKTLKDLPEELINDILEEKMNITQLSKKYECSRKTIYKYKEIIRKGVYN